MTLEEKFIDYRLNNNIQSRQELIEHYYNNLSEKYTDDELHENTIIMINTIDFCSFNTNAHIGTLIQININRFHELKTPIKRKEFINTYNDGYEEYDFGYYIDDFFDYNMLQNDIDKILSTLTFYEEKVIRYRFGLNDIDKMLSIEEVAEILNLTTERIMQFEAKALRKLKHPSRSNRLISYFF